MKLRILPAMAAATVLLSSVWFASPAQAAEANLVPDPILRQCLVDAMQGAGMDTPTQADVITQDDLDALANTAHRYYGLSLSCDDGITTLEGLQYLHDPTLEVISARYGTITDLSPLAGFPNLYAVYMDQNSISDLSPLKDLTNLIFLTLSFNDISDISPLSSLQLRYLNIAGNNVDDLSPLTNVPLQSRPPRQSGMDVAMNHISDLTVISSLCTQANEVQNSTLMDEDDEGWTSCVYPSAAFQTLNDTAVAGSSVPLPTVVGQSDDPVTWRVTQGDATIADGTVTYPEAGTYVLQFQDKPYGDSQYYWYYNDDNPFYPLMASAADCALQNGTWGWNDDAQRDVCTIYADFSGIVTVTVTDRGEPPVPPMSDAVKKDEVAASTTGGAARLADGTDSYTLVVTLRTGENQPAPGYGDELSASVEPAGVSVSGLVDNGDGTYSMTVVSADPGNYLVTVKLNGVEVGDSIPVNFIGADVAVPSVNVANEQSAAGLGFLPGEQVSVTVHSDPLSLGTYKADGSGRVSVTFSMPKGFDLGAHTVDFVGVTSGTAVASFTVVDVSAGTGGTAIPSSGSVVLALVAALCLSAGFAVSMMVRKAR